MENDQANITENQGSRVRLEPGSGLFYLKYTEKAVKYPDSGMVWDAFRYHGQGKLVVLPKIIEVNKEATWKCVIIWKIVLIYVIVR